MRNFKRQSLYLFHNQGSILIVSMWILVCFSILSVGLYGIVSSRLRLAQALERRIMGQYLAKAACVYFKIDRTRGKTGFDTIALLETKREQELGRGKFIYTLKDEESKININKSSLDILARLPEFDKDLAKKVSDSPLRPFHAREELLIVEDVTDEMFNNCKDFITVYGDGGVNINTAPPEVLKILGLDDSLITLITTFRLGNDSKIGTEDDGVFENTGEIINKLRAFSTLYESQEAKIVQLISQNMLVVSSQNYSLQIETTLLGKTAMRYNITMDKDKIKQWSEF